MLLYYFLLVVFFTSVFIQLIFAFGIFSRLIFHRYKTSEIKDKQPVSVLICAHNEYDNLQISIPHILAQNYPFFELIVVNDRSTDGTLSWLQAQQEEDERLRVVDIQESDPRFHSKKYAILQGIQAAHHELILLTDADCYPASPHWIESMQGMAQAPVEIVLGFSPYFKQNGFLNAFIQYETFYTALQYLALALAGNPYMGVGRNLLYSKKTFDKTGFSHKIRHVTGGDDDLFINQVAWARNTAICLEPSSYVYSFPHRTWRAWFKQKLRHLSVGKHYKPQTQSILGLLHLSHGLFWLSLLSTEIYGHSLGEQAWVWEAAFVRISAISVIYAVINHKMRGQVCVICLPLFDFLYVFYIFIVGTLAISLKRIQWQ